MPEMSGLTENLLASQEGLHSVVSYLVRYLVTYNMYNVTCVFFNISRAIKIY